MNRSPMDLVEGESELFGFNVEYFEAEFALSFIAEYGIIIFFFFCYMILLIFRNLVYSCILFINVLSMLIVVVIYIRGILPRVRYDELIYIC